MMEVNEAVETVTPVYIKESIINNRVANARLINRRNRFDAANFLLLNRSTTAIDIPLVP